LKLGANASERPSAFHGGRHAVVGARLERCGLDFVVGGHRQHNYWQLLGRPGRAQEPKQVEAGHSRKRFAEQNQLHFAFPDLFQCLPGGAREIDRIAGVQEIPGKFAERSDLFVDDENPPRGGIPHRREVYDRGWIDRRPESHS
jgi:hypothetical protein